MLKLFFLINILCSNISYKINKISKVTDTSSFEHIATKKNMKFYMEKDKMLYSSIPLPQQVNKLMNIDDLKIKKGDSVYLIKPFEYLTIVSASGIHSTYLFDKMGLDQKSINCLYKNNKKGSQAKIIFHYSEDEPKIEKYFAGEASMSIFKVSGNFLGELRDCRIIHYLIDDGDTSKVETVFENSVQLILDHLGFKNPEKISITDTDDKREEL